MKNPTRRIFFLALVGYLLVAAYFTIWNYRRSCDQAEGASLLRLEGIANAVALQIDGDLHREVAARYPLKDAILYNQQDTDYFHLHYILRRNAEANMLETPIYTMVFDTSQGNFQFIASSADAPYFKHRYDTFDPTLKAKYTEGGTIPMHTDQFGMWLTAFSPVRDERGRAVAVVMVDEQFDAVVVRARRAAFMNSAISLLIILPIIALLIVGLRRLIFREARLKQQLEEAYAMNLKISAELAASYEKLSSLDALRKEMIANISHDLRTPLTNLSGYIETLLMRKNAMPDAERDRYLTIAQQESGRLKKLIDDLFELSKLESKQVALAVEAFPIAELLQDILSKYELVCAPQKIKISSHLSDATPWVSADIKLVDRALQNLLDNAVKYNRPLDGTAVGEIQIALESIGSQLFIEIKNTSTEIDPSVLPHIFDRYFKVSSAENSTGLGLAIVKKIMDLHETDIAVSSENGWTSFRFGLPIFK